VLIAQSLNIEGSSACLPAVKRFAEDVHVTTMSVFA